MADADPQPLTTQSAPEQAQALRRGLVVRIVVALGVLAGIAVLAIVVLGQGGTGADATGPAAASTVPLVVAQSQTPAVSGATPEALPAPATASSEPAPPGEMAGGASPAQPDAKGRQSPETGVDPAPVPETAPSTASKPAPDAPAPTQHSDTAGVKTMSDKPAPAAAPAPEAVRTPPAGKPVHGPRLQAGVFMQPSNAQSFKASLEAQGFPVYIETRVHVGPFKDRNEAELARDKLREMGVATVLIGQ